jgi:hypothetical protein
MSSPDTASDHIGHNVAGLNDGEEELTDLANARNLMS